MLEKKISHHHYNWSRQKLSSLVAFEKGYSVYGLLRLSSVFNTERSDKLLEVFL